MGYTILRPTTHQEWLEERKKGIGSSDAGTIMGASPFQTPYGLYLQKTGQAEPFKESDAMFNGHVLEPAVAEWFAAKTGNIVDITSEGEWMAVDNDRDYLRVSPDRIYWDKDIPAVEQTYENASILEIKSTSKFVDKDDIPDYWYCQIQYQMGIMGIRHGCLCWITGAPNLHFDYVKVDFNPAFFESLIAKIDVFWNENILAGVPPADTNADDTLRRNPVAAKGTTVDATEDVYQACRSLKACRERIKEEQERESILTDIIKMSIGQSEALSHTDKETGEIEVLATWKNCSKEVFDETQFKKDHPELWKRFSICTYDTVLDKKSLAKSERTVYDKYSSKTTSFRKFILK